MRRLLPSYPVSGTTARDATALGSPVTGGTAPYGTALVWIAVAAVVLGALPAYAASAQPAGQAQTVRQDVRYGVEHHGTHVRHGFNIDGGNWAGYVAQGSGFSSVTATWTEPAVTCNSTDDLFAPWVGIDGYTSSTVEQTGVATNCSSGSPVYQGWAERYPDTPVYYPDPVSAGDVITATVTRSGSRYTLTLTDQTSGWSRTTTRSLTAANLSAEVVVESPTTAYPDFGTVSFSGATVNGQPLSAYGPVALDASNPGGYENHTGPLSGDSFAISYLRE